MAVRCVGLESRMWWLKQQQKMYPINSSIWTHSTSVGRAIEWVYITFEKLQNVLIIMCPTVFGSQK